LDEDLENEYRQRLMRKYDDREIDGPIVSPIPLKENFDEKRMDEERKHKEYAE